MPAPCSTNSHKDVPEAASLSVSRVKSLLPYAHRLGFTAFNAGAAVRVKSGNVDRAKRIASEIEVALLIRAAPTKRDRLLLSRVRRG